MTSQVQIIGNPPPRTWDDYERGCLATYRGGHHDVALIAVFQHGMRTVFNLLRREFPPAETMQLAKCRDVAEAFTCLDSNREIKSFVYDPTGEAMSHGDVVDMLNALQAEVYQLRANVASRA